MQVLKDLSGSQDLTDNPIRNRNAETLAVFTLFYMDVRSKLVLKNTN